MKAVVFDVGETLVDETRAWGLYADRSGVSRLTFFAALGALIERRDDHRNVFQLLGIERQVGHDPYERAHQCDCDPVQHCRWRLLHVTRASARVESVALPLRTKALYAVGKAFLVLQVRDTSQRMNRQRRMLLVQHQRIVSAAVVSTRRRWAAVI